MSKKRTRRTGDTVRNLILEAARALFSERGYAGTATREIALRANVSEVLLFRHFKSKAQLFEHAVFEPMERYIREFQQSHLRAGDTDPGGVRETREFVSGLHSLLSRNRHLLMALITAESYEKGVTTGLKASSALEDYFHTAEEHLRPKAAHYRVQLPLGVRLSFATAVGTVLLQDWLLSGLPKKLGSDAFIEQLSLYMLGGLEGARESTASHNRASHNTRSGRGNRGTS